MGFFDLSPSLPRQTVEDVQAELLAIRRGTQTAIHDRFRGMSSPDHLKASVRTPITARLSCLFMGFSKVRRSVQGHTRSSVAAARPRAPHYACAHAHTHRVYVLGVSTCVCVISSCIKIHHVQP